MAYKLELPPQAKIHPVFHVSQLKRVKGEAPTPTHLPSELTAELELQSTPEAVLGVRGSAMQEVLIQWHNQPVEEATWEEFEVLQQQFPAFHLEDKVKVWAAGNVIDPPRGAAHPRPPVKITYSRRHISNRTPGGIPASG